MQLGIGGGAQSADSRRPHHGAGGDPVRDQQWVPGVLMDDGQGEEGAPDASGDEDLVLAVLARPSFSPTVSQS